MMCNAVTKLNSCKYLVQKYSTAVVPLSKQNEHLETRKLMFPPKYQKPRQVWLENLDTIDEKKLGLLDLHPSVFGANPRIDIIQQNVRWQSLYRYVSFAHTKSRFECRGGGRKPWPQKGNSVKNIFSIFIAQVNNEDIF